jgi:hypothetical protein
MVGKPISYVQEEIGLRLHRYEEATKKHGVKLAVGTLSAMLDSKALLAASAAGGLVSLAASPVLSLATTGALMIGNVALHIANALIDHAEVKAEAAGEIVFVCELADRAK